ncbi:unnamed protein product [Nezara viridula]|uniref:Uncharacterized protein n=1 Tax=Nezara viridula TaxID=85310 RepID=A0A9P0E7S6_NEZVI|nr:unnamed protein product [Nezara viridula]
MFQLIFYLNLFQFYEQNKSIILLTFDRLGPIILISYNLEIYYALFITYHFIFLLHGAFGNNKARLKPTVWPGKDVKGCLSSNKNSTTIYQRLEKK